MITPCSPKVQAQGLASTGTGGRSKGQVAFERFCLELGRPLLGAWDNLPKEERSAWDNAAETLFEYGRYDGHFRPLD